LLADRFRSATEWSRTRAFAIPGACTSFLRVNLRGREPEGLVEPGAEYAALLRELEADLRLLVDADTGEPAVRAVARTVDLFGDSAAPSLPDLFVSWKPGRFMERVLHPRAVLEQRRPDFYRRSDHSQHGFVAAAGPQLPCLGAVGELSPLDLAPTFLALLGAPVPEAMDGKPLAL
jgi:predicted AlkP superfamily phosphohydrolase/phosphomutase